MGRKKWQPSEFIRPLVRRLKSGNVTGLTRSTEPALAVESLVNEPEASFSNMSATGTEQILTAGENQQPSISAEITFGDSLPHTVWDRAPAFAALGNFQQVTLESLASLSPKDTVKLLALSEGLGQPVSVTVSDIADFVCGERESLEWEEYSLRDVVTRYLDNYYI